MCQNHYIEENHVCGFSFSIFIIHSFFEKVNHLGKVEILEIANKSLLMDPLKKERLIYK